MSYSQSNEEQIIKDYFGDFSGSVLDLGANDGKTLSNSLSCIERGWSALLIEPSGTAFMKLNNLHLNNDNVQCLNVAVGEKSGHFDFYESGEHLGGGDTSLLSTLKESELNRWAGSGNKFTKTQVKVLTFLELMELSKFKTFDLVSCDCEGVDYEILCQMNLSELNCEMLIIETNGIQDEKYINYCASFGMKPHHKNAENLIFVKK